MNIEVNLLISVLKLTRQGSVSLELVKKDARVSSEIAEKMLIKMGRDGLIYLRNKILEADSFQRLKLAMAAINHGADVESVSSLLQWREFEGIAVLALEKNGYTVSKNFHFSHLGHRWEMDVIACRKPLVICIDCKHWHRGVAPSALRKIVNDQIERTSALAEFLRCSAGKLECLSWSYVRLLPVVLLLFAGRFKFYNDVPVVSVLQLQDFVNQLSIFAGDLKHFDVKRTNLNFFC